ncbi:hypothetical protein NDU88_008217 [Pleurodeles waltl]|uniref:Uncharacterized protein n=1 Tax=Pleurodeles waltl TaxID=8319 RepID=A0AAV7VRX5_PLEWA|nr:hypothetical protein NDU88_008217 [Pleurodeles waltl]
MAKEFLTSGGIEVSVPTSKTGFLTPCTGSCNSGSPRDATVTRVTAEQQVVPLPTFPRRGTRDAAWRLLQSSRVARIQLAAPDSSSVHERLPVLIRCLSSCSEYPDKGELNKPQSSQPGSFGRHFSA